MIVFFRKKTSSFFSFFFYAACLTLCDQGRTEQRNMNVQTVNVDSNHEKMASSSLTERELPTLPRVIHTVKRNI